MRSQLKRHNHNITTFINRTFSTYQREIFEVVATNICQSKIFIRAFKYKSTTGGSAQLLTAATPTQKPTKQEQRCHRPDKHRRQFYLPEQAAAKKNVTVKNYSNETSTSGDIESESDDSRNKQSKSNFNKSKRSIYESAHIDQLSESSNGSIAGMPCVVIKK